MRQLLLALIIMTCPCDIQALFWDGLSAQDQATVVQLDRDIEIFQGNPESDEEYFAYLAPRKDFIHSIINRINYLIRRYPRKTLIQGFTPMRDYLQHTMTRFGLN